MLFHGSDDSATPYYLCKNALLFLTISQSNYYDILFKIDIKNFEYKGYLLFFIMYDGHQIHSLHDLKHFLDEVHLCIPSQLIDILQ